MAEAKMESVLTSAMERLREVVDAETIIGKPIEVGNGVTIIPVSKISFGFGVGGFETDAKGSNSKAAPENAKSGSELAAEVFTGGGGGGVTVSPVCFIVINNGEVKMLGINSGEHPVAKIMESLPELVNSTKKMFAKSDDSEKTADS